VKRRTVSEVRQVVRFATLESQNGIDFLAANGTCARAATQVRREGKYERRDQLSRLSLGQMGAGDACPNGASELGEKRPLAFVMQLRIELVVHESMCSCLQPTCLFNRVAASSPKLCDHEVDEGV
jgi:hypothetical protein